MIKLKKIILLLFLLVLIFESRAQTNLDSLWTVWQDEIQADTTRLNALNTLAEDGYLYSQPDSAYFFAQLQYQFAKKRGYKIHEAKALKTQGTSFWVKGNYLSAKKFYNKSLLIYEEIGDKKGICASLNNIGAIYNSQGQGVRALEFFNKSLKVREEIGDKLGIGTSLLNIGVTYETQGGYEKKLEFYNKSLKIFQEINYELGIAIALGNIGEVYSGLGKDSLALDYFQQGLEVSEEISDKQGMAWILKFIGDIYLDQDNYSKALEFFQRSLEQNEEIEDTQGIAMTLMAIGKLYNIQGNHQKALVSCTKGLLYIQDSGFIFEKKDACECLYDAYKALGNTNKALTYHEQMLVLSDSLKIKETTKKLQEMEFDKQVSADSIAQVEKDRLVQKANDDEVSRKNRAKNIAIGGGLLFMILAGGFFIRSRYIKKSRDLISKEKDISENLLLNILPAEIAEELKSKGKADARNFDNVSILFTDFKSFTETSAKLSAQDLVSEINVCFEVFDGIMGKYGIEKIKTIGDAYMAVGGLPVPGEDSVKNTVLAALEMQAFISKRNVEMDTIGKHSFQMRAGIHTGSVVAGIVGVKKFQYDIWGDAVNTSNRMESNGQVGKVNISKQTYELIKDDQQFTFEKRGKIQAKGKGEIEMYFVERTEI